MDYVTLGRTGLRISVAGLGCGGHSQLGQRFGAPVEESVRLVHEALDLGVNYFDTASEYPTEAILGEALKGRWDDVVVSTKADPMRRSDRTLRDAAAFRAEVETSLARLRTDHIDIFHLHGVRPEHYAYCAEALVPELQRLRDEGTIRAIGLSERFRDDVAHEMLERALDDDCWDVVMVGFNMLNPSARRRVLPRAIEQDVGVEVMYAVRHLLSHPDALRETIARCIELDLVDGTRVNREDPLGFLVHEGGAASVIEAAYRFARHEPGVHVVPTATSSFAHLRANVAAIEAGPLPEPDLAELARLFGHLAHFSGDATTDGLASARP
jgi:L-galactose dehydrogenase